MKKAALLLIPLLFISPPLPADQFSLSLFQSSTNNLFQMNLAEADNVSLLNLSWDKSIGSFSLFCEGGYSYLRRNSGLGSGVLNTGADYLYAINDKTAVYFSFEGGGTMFRSEYADFNYGAARLSASLKTYLSPTSILKAVSASEYKKYRYSLFDFASQTLSFSLDKYFQSKTTLKAEIGWGYKYYLHPVPTEETVVNLGAPASGGRNGFGMGGGPHGGRGPYLKPTLTGDGKGVQIVSLTGLLAQGLGDRIGLRLSGLKQWTLSGENPFTSVEDFYMVENPTYDHYSWNGYALNGQLTVEIPWNVEMKIGYTISEKEYPGIESLGLDGLDLGVTRKDQRNQFEVKIEKNFSAFSLFFSYARIKNASNDPLFDWKGHLVSGGLQWNIVVGKNP